MTNELGEHVTIVIDNNDMNPPHKPNIQTKFETPEKFSAEQIRKHAYNIGKMLEHPEDDLPKSQCIEAVRMNIQDGLTYYFSSGNCWKKINCDPAKLEITFIQKQKSCKCGDNCARNLATGGCTDDLVKRLIAPFLPEFYQER